MEKVFLVGVGLKGEAEMAASSLEELRRLTETAGGTAVGQLSQSLARYHPGTLIGAGKIEEIRAAAKTRGARTVIFDAELMPAQQVNLEKALGAKIIDRTRLILDIFAKRARTSEGRLQVELAQLSYMLPRLTGAWRAFSQQVGGIGTRGPGERQLEYERRHIQRRILHLKRDLERIRNERALRRRKRLAIPVPQVALVGYTNVGKSTLLNALTKGQAPVYADDKLFATLDPTSRRVRLPEGSQAVFTDTVGFIQRLPTALIAAFRATLEEVRVADCIVLVSDASAPGFEAQEKAVIATLDELEADGIPRLSVFNKADALSPIARRELELRYPDRLFISAATGEGLDAALKSVERSLASRWMVREVALPHSELGRLPLLYRSAQVLSQRQSKGRLVVSIRVTAENWQRLRALLKGAVH